jgi:hypothetical protein
MLLLSPPFNKVSTSHSLMYPILNQSIELTSSFREIKLLLYMAVGCNIIDFLKN